jgi:predicted phosphodiesterase
MRLAVLSDIHGNLPALDAVLAEVARETLDGGVSLGDLLSGPLWPRETADRLRALGWPTVAGNHERQALATGRPQGFSDAYAAVSIGAAHRAWIAALPAALDLDGGAIRLIHGTPHCDDEPLLETVMPDLGVHGSPGIRAARPDEVLARMAPTSASLVLCGHSHVPRAMAIGSTLFVNPGSVGLPAYDHDQPHDHVVECGSPHARWAIVERGPQGWQAQLRLTAYDWNAAAARAAANGRGDWADALATGFVGRKEKDLSG